MAAAHSHLVTQVIWKLEYYGAFVWRNNTGAFRPRAGGFMRFGYPGSPDVIGILPDGRFIGVECGVGKDMLNAKQVTFRMRTEAVRGVYWEIRNIHEVEALYAQLKTK